MTKVASYDIVFQEVPGEVTLALNISGCPCHCKGCHSPHLWEDTGEPLTTDLLDTLMEKYAGLITCVCFMGGDRNPEEIFRLAKYIKNLSATETSGLSESPAYGIKVAWYSGRPYTPETFNTKTPFNYQLSTFNYLKFGPYIESLGGLKSERTNQRLYKRVGNGTSDAPYEWQDITSSFWRNSL
ncbi:MAG: 4Fe-4S cluster-binding domain-containing protein [Paludibacteraceae bacterium]|nr:4Fe-4S cluster-binding domain-containing protein [Paludibacteraceae bacterium]